MKKLVQVVILVFVIAFAVPVFAQSADATSWSSAITYYTPSSVPGTLQVSFYAEGSSTPINAAPITLAPHKAGSLQVGTVSGVPSGFKGSAVLSSDVPVIATNVEIASSPNQGQYARSIYDGMTANDAASTFYVASALRQTFNTNSQFGVQNIESFDANAVLRFFSGPTEVFSATRTIKAQSSIVFKVGDLAGAPATLNGSLVISAHKTGDPATPARVVASAVERDISGRRAKAFEGVANGGTQIFMASMLCNSGSPAQTSTYAIQNAAGASADYSVTFYNTAGAVAGTVPTATLASGAKASINPCGFGVPNGTSGSAVINATAPIIAIGKVAASDGTGTAFNGATSGSTTVIAPYIRWNAPTVDYFTNIAIMNVGSVAATNIQVKYYDGNGTLAATHVVASAGTPLGKYIKTNSNPSVAGALTGGTFGYSPAGGAVEIVSDQPIVVVVRATRNVSFGSTTKFSEDYNGVPYTP
jgi:hypothetical protein